jgi:putative transcriptional regulator
MIPAQRLRRLTYSTLLTKTPNRKKINMIIITLKRAIFKRQVDIGRSISLKELSQGTDISRMTLYRMIKEPTYNACLDHLGRISDYLECDISELLSSSAQVEIRKANVA